MTAHAKGLTDQVFPEDLVTGTLNGITYLFLEDVIDDTRDAFVTREEGDSWTEATVDHVYPGDELEFHPTAWSKTIIESVRALASGWSLLTIPDDLKVMVRVV